MQMGTGGWPISMQLPRSAWFAPHAAPTGGSPWGLRTCPINRARRLAKTNRNRQGPTNNVPFPRGRTLWHPIGNMRGLYLHRLCGRRAPLGRPGRRPCAAGPATISAGCCRADSTPPAGRHPPGPSATDSGYVRTASCRPPCRGPLPAGFPSTPRVDGSPAQPGVVARRTHSIGLPWKDRRCGPRPPGSDGPPLAGPLGRPGSSGSQRPSDQQRRYHALRCADQPGQPPYAAIWGAIAANGRQLRRA
jgi:hypothetical protein